MPNLRAVILTALRVEFEAVRAFVINSHEVEHPAGNIYEQGTFTANGRTWDIGIAEVGMGDSVAALETERVISFFDPQVILFVGVAGGIKDVRLGDVVAATKVYNYEYGKAKAEFESRSELGLSSYALIERAKAEARNQEQRWRERLGRPDVMPDVRVSAIAAGEKVIASTQSSVYQFLRQRYSDALAVEMEGYGFLKAAHANAHRASAIVVRGISDLIDGKNDVVNQPPESKRQATAAHHASAFAFQILANFEPNVGLLGSQAPDYKVSAADWDQVFIHFSDGDVPVIAPLCRQVFEQNLTAETVAFAYPEFAQVKDVRGLRQLFMRADDVSLAVAWVGKVIDEFKQPSDGAEVRPVPFGLQSWYDNHRPAEPEPDLKQKSPGYLLVTLEPKDDEDTVAIRAEFDDGTGNVTTDL
ncbi:MAG: 5'-methylthioadenosine/S-adenosylhomocysteine nucleosidase, partial [Cyanobacteria bacterium P01_F01_bin.116]